MRSLRFTYAFSLGAVLVAGGCDDAAGGLTNAGNATWTKQATGISNTLIAVGQGVGIKSTEVYAEAEGMPPNAPILKYDGSAWVAAHPTVTSCLTCKTPRTASIDRLIINAGLSGGVDRWDPGRMAWTSEKTGLTSDILALWAADPTHVFAVGDRGGIAFFDGKAWKVMVSPTNRPLRAVFGASAIDVYAVGDGGTVIHFDGTAWKAEESGTVFSLRDVWGSSLLGFFAVGEGGTILHHLMF